MTIILIQNLVEESQTSCEPSIDATGGPRRAPRKLKKGSKIQTGGKIQAKKHIRKWLSGANAPAIDPPTPPRPKTAGSDSPVPTGADKLGKRQIGGKIREQNGDSRSFSPGKLATEKSLRKTTKTATARGCDPG